MIPELDRQSSIPLYLQLKKHLMNYIAEDLKPGDMMPIESEIEKRYNVSRMTVRKTIDELVNDGIVVRQQGRGTFVQSLKIIQDAGKITSWTEEMKQKGKQTETKGLEIFEMSSSKKLKDMLKLSKGEKVICVKRVRHADGEPIAIMVNYLRSKLIPDFLEKGLQFESLYEELEKNYNIVIEEANELIKAREATELEALSLKIPPYSAVLHITRTSYLNDAPLEIVEMTTRADRYEYHIQLSGRQKTRLLYSDGEEH